MKTLQTIALSLFAVAIMVACNNAPAEKTEVETGITGTFNADAAASVINWEGSMLGMYSHTGTISLTSGSIMLENEMITGGEFMVDMTSIKTTDANYDSAKGKTPDKLIGHLSTGQFFQVDSFPTAMFKITGSDSTGVMGDLTIRGITHAEKVTNVTVNKTESGIKLTGDLTFDRSKYDVLFTMDAKEMVLSNDIKLAIELVAQP